MKAGNFQLSVMFGKYIYCASQNNIGDTKQQMSFKNSYWLVYLIEYIINVIFYDQAWYIQTENIVLVWQVMMICHCFTNYLCLLLCLGRITSHVVINEWMNESINKYGLTGSGCCSFILGHWISTIIPLRWLFNISYSWYSSLARPQW